MATVLEFLLYFTIALSYDLSDHFTWKSTSESPKLQKKGRSRRETRERNTEARIEAVGAEAARLLGLLSPLKNDIS